MNEDQERVDYHTYIRSQAWGRKRWGALQRAGHACQVCKSTERLHIHHNTYSDLGHESASSLICLCSECHDLFHKHRKLVPPPQEVWV